MAISFVNKGVGSGSNVNNVVITAPASITTGDILVACITNDSSGDTLTGVPTGWTLSKKESSTNGFNDATCYIYTKVATGSEPANYTFTGPLNRNWRGLILAYRGAAPTIPTPVAGHNNSASSHVCPSDTAVVAGEQVIYFFAVRAETGSLQSTNSNGDSLTSEDRTLVNTLSANNTADFNKAASGSTGTSTITTGVNRSCAFITQRISPAVVDIDADIYNMTLTPSADDHGPLEDSGTETFKLTPSGTETSTDEDSATEYLKLDPATTQEGPAGFTDTAIEDFKLTPSGTDILTHSYPDAATEYLKFTPSGLESDTTYVDAETERLALVPSGVDLLFSSGDAGTELFKFTPSSDDHICPGKVEFEGELEARWSATRKNKWAAQAGSRWETQFLGVGEGFAC